MTVEIKLSYVPHLVVLYTTTVTWRRNCLAVQNSSDFVQNQVVTNTAIATYENTLMLNGANIDGVYTCLVKNSRGYSSSVTGIGSKYMFYFTTEYGLDECMCQSRVDIL